VDDPGESLTFLGRQLSARFAVRFVRMAPGARRPYVEAEWRGALVVVERGTVELECRGGASRAFAPGSVLWLVGLPLRALHSRGPEPALLSVVTRSDEFAAGPQL
jgi:hypothetical protein